MKTLKHLSALLLVILTSVALAACGNENDSKLNGTWKGTGTMEESGVEISVTTVLDFNSDNHNFDLTLDFNMPELGDYLTVNASGEWAADSDYITLEYDKNSFTFKFNELMESLISQADIENIKKEMIDEMGKNNFVEKSKYGFTGSGDLRMDVANAKITFKKQ